MPDLTDPLLTPKQAAEILNCSESFLAKKRVTGDGPSYVKIGRGGGIPSPRWSTTRRCARGSRPRRTDQRRPSRPPYFFGGNDEEIPSIRIHEYSVAGMNIRKEYISTGIAIL